MSLPNRASDAGPDSRTRCPKCDSSKWNTLTSCNICGGTVCNRCEGAEYMEANCYDNRIICGKCAAEAKAIAEEAWGEIPVLKPITARVRMPNVPEFQQRCRDAAEEARERLITDNPHASDCAHWVGEPCDCLTNPDGPKARALEGK